MAEKVAAEGKAVVITGASSGIGRESALALDRAGFRVFAGVRREEDGVALKQDGSERLSWVLIDVTDRESIRRAAEQVRGQAGGAAPWGLMANAGIGVMGSMELMGLDEFERLFRVNVFGVVAAVQAFLPAVRGSRGRIVITGSQGGRMGLPMIGAYNASKHALEAIADALRMELYRFGVRVSLLEPGSIRTPIWGKNLKEAERMLEGVSAEDRALYAMELTAAVRMARLQERLSIPPAKAARAVLHAFTAARPRARYLIGLDAHLNLLLNALVPTTLKDAGIRAGARYFGRP